MAPGSSSLLRARRRDATLKPNRVLDKSSSRGMIYENEELRLRTININAEVERSQSDIKKLRRENELLRREIWGLRDECDRLEELLKRKEHEEEEEDEEPEEEEEEEEESSEDEDKEESERSNKRRERKGGVLSSLGDTLSVVQEEPEDPLSRDSTPMMSDNPDRRCEVYEGTHPPLLRFNCVHPYTAATTIDSLQLPALTVGEVIEGCWKTVGAKLEGVRLLGGSLFLSFKDRNSLESLVGLGLTLRGVHKIDLEDVSQGTLVLAMSGVPHTLQDSSLTKVLSQFGPIIGYIERRFYRNVDTGERLARIRLMSSLPKRIYVEGHEISIRSLPHDELAKLATLPSRIVRSTLQVSVNVARTLERNEATPSSVTSLSCTSTPGTPAPSRSTTPFVFPTTPQPQQQPKDPTDGGSSPSVLRRGGDSETSGSTRRSRQRVRRGHSPSSSSEQESPNKPPRRKMSIRRRDPLEDGILLERERSNSLSSRCSERRKLSVTGRESGKLPWFGCWGNGCI